MANNLAAAKAEMWADEMQKRNYESYVGAFVANRKFEGDFVGNDTVHFTYGNGVTVSDLASSYDTFSASDAVITDDTFVLNIRKVARVDISDEDYIEMKINPDNHYLIEMADGFAKEYDTEIMKQYANANIVMDGVDIGETAGDIEVTDDNVYKLVTAIGQKLDEANAPSTDRWIVVSPKEKVNFLNSQKLVHSTEFGDRRIRTGGLLGTISNFTIYYSNNLQTVSTTKHLLAGTGKPISFAANIKPNVQFVGSEMKDNSFVNTIKAQTKFGVKVFEKDKDRLVDVPVVAA